MLLRASAGTDQSGPMRGNSTYKISMAGKPIRTVRPDALMADQMEGRYSGRCASTSEVSKPQNTAPISAAVRMLWE